ncbi:MULTISPECIES: DUF1707 SHOCT-like domain-containing protein [Nocardiopsis]|uniref:DUF1707 domain-containing protein n=2 Tax=Nocardiopsis alba TaxID=53437 RepID=A0A7K2ISI8_9ACTN|nr:MULTISPECIES: DUF1707 domain-containing protein [Nocardiopsis]AFR06441.1 hypothetical protein B005_1818 [Nocardiopsis alba ATCC BAA-2165]MEC3895254.1 DUF1707 domain-containing protein [Nocardiopsis sp. LDBS1602]MYR32774.1 DUF1707 domain-containing protein [Nocardiopsis alba]
MQPEHIRASDADRDQVAERLREALAEGRLTPVEHEERLDTLYRAKTIGELAPIVSDLPSPGAPGPVPGYGGTDRSDGPDGMEILGSDARDLAGQSKGSENLVAVFGGAERRGRWLVEPRTNVSVLCGGVELDLREAVLSRHEVTIQLAVIMGGVDITVPHGVRVINNTSAILGGADLHGTDQVTDPNAPVVHLTGSCMLGGVDVKAKKSKKKRKDRREK